MRRAAADLSAMFYAEPILFVFAIELEQSKFCKPCRLASTELAASKQERFGPDTRSHSRARTGADLQYPPYRVVSSRNN